MLTLSRLTMIAGLVAFGLAACSSSTHEPVRGEAVDAGLPELPAPNSATDAGSDAAVADDPAHQACARYVACATVVAPATVAAVLEGYGPKGTCWSAGDPALCAQACRGARAELLHLAKPSPECRCSSDAECPSDAPRCDVATGLCGACTSDAQCGKNQTCFRTPHGATCADCDASSFNTCGPISGESPDLWSAASMCSVLQPRGGLRCVECETDDNCRGRPCDKARGVCTNSPAANLLGIFERLRNAPMACTGDPNCCAQSRCPGAGDYVKCMSEHCVGCEGRACTDCSVQFCKAVYGSARSTCS